MKKLIYLFIVLLLVGTSFADESHKFYITEDKDMIPTGSESMRGYTFTTEATESVIFDLNNDRPQGFSTLEITISGAGTLQIYHESSIAGRDYSTIKVNGTTASNIVASMTAGSEIYQFSTPHARYMKLNFVGSEITIVNTALQIQ